MSRVYADLVEETTATTGTGTLSLAGATTGNRTFVAGIGDGNECGYAIKSSTGQYEVGIGTITDGSPDTLSRDTLKASSTGSKLDLPSGTHTVYCTLIAEDADRAIDKAQTWTGSQRFSAGGSVDVVAEGTLSSTDTVTLSGRWHTMQCAASTGSTISFTGGSNCQSDLLFVQNAADGSGPSWSGAKVMYDKTINTTASEYNMFSVSTPDGGTTYFVTLAGVEQ
jgi:hypothetical protein